MQNLVDDFVQTFEFSLNELKSDSQLPKKFGITLFDSLKALLK